MNCIHHNFLKTLRKEGKKEKGDQLVVFVKDEWNYGTFVLGKK